MNKTNNKQPNGRAQNRLSAIARFSEELRIRSYSSVKLNELNELPKSPGIYYAVEFGEVVYVGQAINIRKRWQDHEKLALLSSSAKIYFRCIPRISLDSEEAHEIRLFTPKFNTQYPKPSFRFQTLFDAAEKLVWVLLLASGVVIGFKFIYPNLPTVDPAPTPEQITPKLRSN